VGWEAAAHAWKYMVASPFFASAVLEASPAIDGHRLIGLGASILVTSTFADTEIANPSPDINSRVVASICSGQPVVATRNEIAMANAGDGVDVFVVCGNWRDEILGPEERQTVQTLFASSFAEWLHGFRIRRILYETTYPPARQFAESSVVYRSIAEFPELGRTIHLMTRESVTAMPASIGNLIFSFNEPVLRLRDSDQQLLCAALRGGTDGELAAELELTPSAIKARWRSIFARAAETMPALLADRDEHEGRGLQKRHLVLAYVRSHPEELRPYDSRQKPKSLNDETITATA
jgi:hypothetical protein